MLSILASMWKKIYLEIYQFPYFTQGIKCGRKDTEIKLGTMIISSHNFLFKQETIYGWNQMPIDKVFNHNKINHIAINTEFGDKDEWYVIIHLKFNSR